MDLLKDLAAPRVMASGGAGADAEQEWLFATDFAVGGNETTEAQLGIRNDQQVNRPLITRDEVGDTSFWARLCRVQYGTHDGRPACLIVIDFSFRFLGRTMCRYSHAKIEVKFSQAVKPSDHKIRSLEYDTDPKVVIIAPKEVYGTVTVVEGKKYREVSIPVMFDSPLGLSTGLETKWGTEVSEHQDHRMEMHGDLYWDDDHVEGACGAIWDLRENEIQKDGIFRSFKAAIVVEHPAASPMWMHVVVEPSVKFSLDVRRLFSKTEPFARLLQRNDHPILLDGNKALGSPIGSGVDFLSEDFPWHQVVWLPSESKVRCSGLHLTPLWYTDVNQSRLLSRSEGTEREASSGRTGAAPGD